MAGANLTEGRGAPPTLIVADDRPVLRAGLATLLKPLPVAIELPLTGLAEALDEHGGLEVDLLVVGVRDADPEAFASIASVATRRRSLPVLAVADSASVIELREAVIAGVDSFLLTSTPADELRDAVRRTLAGERVIAPSIAIQLASAGRPGDAGGVAALTRQELDVLRLASDGMTNDAIAEELGIGSRTVKTRIQAVLGKLEVPDRTAAVARALRLGLIS